MANELSGVINQIRRELTEVGSNFFNFRNAAKQNDDKLFNITKDAYSAIRNNKKIIEEVQTNFSDIRNKHNEIREKTVSVERNLNEVIANQKNITKRVDETNRAFADFRRNVLTNFSNMNAIINDVIVSSRRQQQQIQPQPVQFEIPKSAYQKEDANRRSLLDRMLDYGIYRGFRTPGVMPSVIPGSGAVSGGGAASGGGASGIGSILGGDITPKLPPPSGTPVVKPPIVTPPPSSTGGRIPSSGTQKNRPTETPSGSGSGGVKDVGSRVKVPDEKSEVGGKDHPLAKQRMKLGGHKLTKEQKLHFYATMMAEIGPQGQASEKDYAALMETPYNRGTYEKDKNIMQNITKAYYEPLRPWRKGYKHYQLALRTLKKRKDIYDKLDRAHNRVLMGSNISNLGTQNSSIHIAEAARRTQTITHTTGTGETISRKDRMVGARIHGLGTVRQTQKWVRETEKAIKEWNERQKSGVATEETPTRVSGEPQQQPSQEPQQQPQQRTDLPINTRGFGVGKVFGQNKYSQEQIASRQSKTTGNISFVGIKGLENTTFRAASGRRGAPSTPSGTYTLNRQRTGRIISSYYSRYGTSREQRNKEGAFGVVYNVGRPGAITSTGYDPKVGRSRQAIQIHSNVVEEIEKMRSRGCITVAPSEYPKLVKAIEQGMKQTNGKMAIVVQNDGRGNATYQIMPASMATNPISTDKAISNMEKTGNLSGNKGPPEIINLTAAAVAAGTVDMDLMPESVRNLKVKTRKGTQTLGELGVERYSQLSEKGGQAFAGGRFGKYNDPNVTFMAGEIQSILGGKFNRITAQNDRFHHGSYANRYKSAHLKGTKLDFTIKGNYKKEVKKLTDEMRKKYGLIEGRDYRIVRNFDHGTGRHVDIGFTKSGRERINFYRRKLRHRIGSSGAIGPDGKPLPGMPIDPNDTLIKKEIERRNLLDPDYALIKNKQNEIENEKEIKKFIQNYMDPEKELIEQAKRKEETKRKNLLDPDRALIENEKLKIKTKLIQNYLDPEKKLIEQAKRKEIEKKGGAYGEIGDEKIDPSKINSTSTEDDIRKLISQAKKESEEEERRKLEQEKIGIMYDVDGPGPPKSEPEQKLPKPPRYIPPNLRGYQNPNSGLGRTGGNIARGDEGYGQSWATKQHEGYATSDPESIFTPES